MVPINSVNQEGIIAKIDSKIASDESEITALAKDLESHPGPEQINADTTKISQLNSEISALTSLSQSLKNSSLNSESSPSSSLNRAFIQSQLKA